MRHLWPSTRASAAHAGAAVVSWMVLFAPASPFCAVLRDSLMVNMMLALATAGHWALERLVWEPKPL